MQENLLSEKLQLGVDFVFRHKMVLVLLLVLLLQVLPNAGFLPWGGLWMRMQTNGMLHAEHVALQDVSNEVLVQLEQKVHAQFPEKSAQERKRMAYAELVRRWDAVLPMLRERAAQRAVEYRDFTVYEVNGKKYSYMYTLDSFYFLRFARNLVERGLYGDVVRDGVQYDTLVTAPLGDSLNVFWLHPFIMAVFFKLFSFVDASVPLMEAVSLLPIVVVVCCLLLVFWLAYRMFDLCAGFFAALIFGLFGTAVYYTAWGFADTEAFILFFSLLALVFFSHALLSESRLRQVGFMLLSGLSLALFSRVWQGWWFLLDVFLGVLGVHVVYQLWVRKGRVGYACWLLVFFFLSSAVMVSLLFDVEEFRLGLLSSAVSYHGSITSGVRQDVWPNVYRSVSELQGISLIDVVRSNGGWLIFVLVFGAFVYVLLSEKSSPAALWCAVLLLWLVGMIYATSKAIRFAVLLVVPLSFGFGVVMSLIHRRLVKLNVVPRVMLVLVVVGGFLVIMNSQQVQGGYAAIVNEKPFLNDAWFEVLSAIKSNSLSDAIITSWWDLGHIIKYVAERPVTFDGASQHRLITYWVGRFFSTSDEDEAVGILRMLDCGSTKAFEVLEGRMNNTFEAVDMLNSVLVAGDDEAVLLLGEHAASVLPLLKCDPPEGFVVVSGDMVLKANVWSHIGGWDPRKARAVQVVRGMSKIDALGGLQSELGWNASFSESEYDVILTSEDEKYISSEWVFDKSTGSCVNISVDVLACGNGVVMNLSSHEVTRINGDELYSVVYAENGVIEEHILDGSARHSVLLIPSGGDKFETILVSRELAMSMFSRLYFFKGVGLKHFKLFTWKPVLKEGPLFAYKVDWGNVSNVSSLNSSNLQFGILQMS